VTGIASSWVTGCMFLLCLLEKSESLKKEVVSRLSGKLIKIELNFRSRKAYFDACVLLRENKYSCESVSYSCVKLNM